MTVLLPEIVLAHAIVERAAAIQSLDELRDGEIDDLEVSYVPWSWRRVMGWIERMGRKALCCCSASTSGPSEATAEGGVEVGAPHVKWTLTHSYYANMGGFRLGITSHEKFFNDGWYRYPTIAITTRQFSYLRQKGVIHATPAISEEEIRDKAKADFFTNGIAVVQILWLFLSLIARAAKHLATSQLEILTAAFAACAVATYCFAWNKPKDVNTATTIHILRPLDIAERQEVGGLQPKFLLDF
jgi:hypothetical protein